MKKYIIYTIKRHIPLFAVTFAVCFSIFMSYFSSISIEYTVYSGYDYYNYSLFGNLIDSGIITVSIPLAILTMILPIFANTYRYRLRAADVFYQVGKGKKSIRYTNNITLLVAVLASFTIAFILGLLILFARQIPNINKAPNVVEFTSTGPYGYEITESRTTYYLVFNFLYYLPTYLILVVAGLINYFISYFLVTRSNNLVNSIIILFLGQLTLGIGIMSPFWYTQILLAYIGNSTGEYIDIISNLLGGTQTATIISPIAWTYYLFDSLITGFGRGIDSSWFIDMSAADVVSLALSIVCTLLYVLMGVLGFLYFLKENESSGEFAGKAPGRDYFQIIIFHIGFGLIGLWSTLTNTLSGSIQTLVGIISVISESIIFGAIYYVFLGLLRRNFKINKKEIIIMAGSVSINMILGLVMTVVMPSIFG